MRFLKIIDYNEYDRIRSTNKDDIDDKLKDYIVRLTSDELSQEIMKQFPTIEIANVNYYIFEKEVDEHDYNNPLYVMAVELLHLSPLDP